MHQIDISRIDLNLLVTFEALFIDRHVGRAAKRMNLSQSAMSHALGRLRRLFDDPLFIRHSGGITPTARARELERLVGIALAQVRHIMTPSTPFDPATLKRIFAVASHDHAIAVVLAKMLPRLRSQAPGVDLRCIAMSYAELATAFDLGTVDFACGAFVGFSAQRIERIPLFQDRLVGLARAGHPILSSKVDLGRLIEFPHVAVSPGPGSYSPIDEALRKAGVEWRVVMSTPSPLAVPALVGDTDLIAVVPERFAVDAANRYHLRSFSLPLALPSISCDLLLPKAMVHSSEFRWIADLIIETVGTPVR